MGLKALGGPFSQIPVYPEWGIGKAKRPGYSLQILAPIAYAQAAVGFPLLSLPEESVQVLGFWWFK